MDNNMIRTIAVVNNFKIIFNDLLPISLVSAIDRFEIGTTLGLSKKIISKAFYVYGIKELRGPLVVLYLEGYSHAVV